MNFKKNYCKNQSLPFTPIIIIGAPRSGTNALRDALTNVPGFDSWPCDEINGIWKHGNLRYEYDDLQLSHVSEPVTSYIRNCFYRRWLVSGRPNFLVEKTTANSLRVPYVKKIIPEAKLLFLIRDGDSVTKSAAKRWRGEFEYSLTEYWLKKLPYMPIRDFPYYFFSTLKNRLSMFVSEQRVKGMSSWGPRHSSFSDIKNLTLQEKCIMQWAVCLLKAAEALDRSYKRNDHVVITYDLLSKNPEGALLLISDFLERPELSRYLTEFSKDLVFGGKKPREAWHIKSDVKVVADEALSVYEKLNEASLQKLKDLTS